MRFASVLMLSSMLLISLFPMIPVTADDVGGRDSDVVVPQFGSAGADFTVIASSVDQLDVPRDMEFHPSPAREWELWVVNRGTESITIIHDAGQASQSSENRRDEYADHFMADVSALAFGQWDAEFDHIFATAQESRNGGNDFMGPALWPSSLDRFAEDNQGDGGGLGSHLDMLHESPQGMGIAHDSGNAYWYFDGFHGNLVYYDFQDNHETGGEDHNDGIVRRYSEVELNRYANVPGHMQLDKSTGVLYIADTGNNRIVWVDTDAPVTLTATTEGQMDSTLEEYSEASGASWGVFSYGVTRPSGLVLGDDHVFVSERSTGKIHAFDYDGNSVAELQTNADEIMGLELDPDGNLWFVDSGEDRIYRVDPRMDIDLDGFDDDVDNCPYIANDQSDNDEDGDGDACDDDDDDDGLLDDDDGCPQGDHGWTASPQTDADGDGCQDAGEDLDDDNDGFLDFSDNCPMMVNDQSNYDLDSQGDACDEDDDNDGFADDDDDCPLGMGSSTEDGVRGCPDADMDGWADSIDALPAESTQWYDADEDGYGDNPLGNMADDCPAAAGSSTVDRTGCLDSDEDGRSDPDAGWSLTQGADAFRQIPNQWSDFDADGFGDNWGDIELNSTRADDGIGQWFEDAFQPDACPAIAGDSTFDRYGCPDADGDGWSDEGDAFPENGYQWSDVDADGYGDNELAEDYDDCPTVSGSSYWGAVGCPDGDADQWADSHDAFPADPTQWKDSDLDGYGSNPGQAESDACPSTPGNSTEDRYGCPDSDGDGYSDLNDALPADDSEWMDGDMDGVGDKADSCPGTALGSDVDEKGCTFSQSMMAAAAKPIVYGPVIGILLMLVAGLVLLTLGRDRGRKQDSAFADAPDFTPHIDLDLPPMPMVGGEAVTPVAAPQPVMLQDPARDYYDSLISQGYAHEQAAHYTVIHYPQFRA